MFINAFKNVGWSHHPSIYDGEKNKTRVQTVLEVYERHVNNGYCIDDFTIEHILPDSADTSNGQIGNLMPLEYSLNKECEAKELAEKVAIYRKSQYHSARKMAERYTNQHFDPEKRTEYMAKIFYKEILSIL